MLEKVKGKIRIRYILLFLLYFILQFKSININFSDTDEFDIFIGGEAIYRGFLMYKDFVSQHMPFSYYLSAVFWLLGAHSVFMQRIYFYIFFAAFWAFAVKRNSKILNEKTLAFFPVIYIFAINGIISGTTILSEHLTGLGLVLLMLEFRMFIKENRLSTSSCIIISLSIVLSFGTTFVSILCIMVVFLAVAVTEFRLCADEKKKVGELLSYLKTKYLKLVLICAAPWVVLCVFYLITGTFDEFIYNAYELNRTIYTEYNGEYGNNILSTMTYGIDFNIGFVQTMLTNLFGGSFSINTFVLSLLFCISFYYIIKTIVHGNRIEGIMWLFLIVEASSRGINNVHSSQVTAMMSLICSICFFENEYDSRTASDSRFRTAPYICILMMSVCFMSDLSSFFKISIPGRTNSYPSIISEITEKDEGIWKCAIGNNYLFIESGRAPIKTLDAPWIWDANGKNFLEEFGDEPPRVCIFNQAMEVWGHKLSDYAPELIEYVNMHYKTYSGLLYIRNDYYDEAVSKIQAMFEASGEMYTSCNVSADCSEFSITLQQPESDYDHVIFAVWADENGQDDMVWYDAQKNENASWSCNVNIANHGQIGFYNFHVYTKADNENDMTFIDSSYIYIDYKIPET